MNASKQNTQHISIVSWGWINPPNAATNPAVKTTSLQADKPSFDPLRRLRQWLDNIEVQDAKLAHSVCKLIPAQCPFEREIKLVGHTLFHIPPLCKLNPVYDQVVALRFRALCYLADVCGEDISPYC